MSDELDAVLAMHNELIARRGVEVWVGAEPTFTRADSLEPAWIGTAEGDDKLARAHALANHLAGVLGAKVSDVPGRHYPDEPAPRFAVAVEWEDHYLTVTPDPGVVEVNMAPCADLRAFA